MQVNYAPVQTFSGKAQGTMDNVHANHFDLRTPGPSFAPQPALTLDPINYASAPKSPRTVLPYVRYNAAQGESASKRSASVQCSAASAVLSRSLSRPV